MIPKKRFEEHPIIWIGVLVVSAFGAGWFAGEEVERRAGNIMVTKSDQERLEQLDAAVQKGDLMQRAEVERLYVLRSLVASQAWATVSPVKETGWIISDIYNSSSQFDALTGWVNSCKPDSMGDIKALYGQLGRGAPYSVQVFCKPGAGKAGELTYGSHTFSQGGFDPKIFSSLFLNPNVVILLQYAGQDNAIYYLKPKQ